MGRLVSLLLLVALALIPTWSTGDDGVARQDAASAYVSSLGDKVFEKSRDRSVTGLELEKYIHGLLARELNVTMFKRLIEDHWENMSHEERVAYQEAIISFLIAKYVRRLCLERDRNYIVLEAWKQGQMYLVGTEITSIEPRTKETSTWVVRYSDNRFSIFDVIFEGVSQLQFWKEQFDAYFARPDNNGIPGLIAFLEKSVDRQTADCQWEW
jgi:ABC-type transporter MlaC component